MSAAVIAFWGNSDRHGQGGSQNSVIDSKRRWPGCRSPPQVVRMKSEAPDEGEDRRGARLSMSEAAGCLI
jgi:hypothetical protein